jgi:hypothetical protein
MSFFFSNLQTQPAKFMEFRSKPQQQNKQWEEEEEEIWTLASKHQTFVAPSENLWTSLSFLQMSVFDECSSWMLDLLIREGSNNSGFLFYSRLEFYY